MSANINIAAFMKHLSTRQITATYFIKASNNENEFLRIENDVSGDDHHLSKQTITKNNLPEDVVTFMNNFDKFELDSGLGNPSRIPGSVLEDRKIDTLAVGIPMAYKRAGTVKHFGVL